MEEASAMGLGTGTLQRQRAAVNLVHQVVSAETANNEDHTFSGCLSGSETKPPTISTQLTHTHCGLIFTIAVIYM